MLRAVDKMAEAGLGKAGACAVRSIPLLCASFYDSIIAGCVAFGQLLGMCDHVAFPLGQAGYSIYKVVPYGPIRVVRLVLRALSCCLDPTSFESACVCLAQVLPYLIRRAHENSDVLGRSGVERKMIGQVLWKRFVSTLKL